MTQRTWGGRTPQTPAQDRFWAKVQPADVEHCWLWTAYTDRLGYSKVGMGGKVYFAHRVTYEYLIGEIPDGLVLDHLCRTPACVNPWHLDPVPQRINIERGVLLPDKRARTHCKHGHEWTPENTGVRASGARLCLTCSRKSGREGYHRRKAKRG